MRQTNESIVQVPISSLRSFPNHPFRITDDPAIQQPVENIRLLGVLNPVIIRYMDSIYARKNLPSFLWAGFCDSKIISV